MVGEIAEEPAAEGAHQEGRREDDGDVQLLDDRVVAGEEGGREIERERRVGVEIVPLDEIADRTDEDRLDPPPSIGEVDMVRGRMGCLLSHFRPFVAAGKAYIAFPSRNGNWRGPRTVPCDQVTVPAGSRRKSGIRFSHSSSATCISMRARLEPTQR